MGIHQDALKETDPQHRKEMLLSPSLMEKYSEKVMKELKLLFKGTYPIESAIKLNDFVTIARDHVDEQSGVYIFSFVGPNKEETGVSAIVTLYPYELDFRDVIFSNYPISRQDALSPQKIDVKEIAKRFDEAEATLLFSLEKNNQTLIFKRIL